MPSAADDFVADDDFEPDPVAAQPAPAPGIGAKIRRGLDVAGTMAGNVLNSASGGTYNWLRFGGPQDLARNLTSGDARTALLGDGQHQTGQREAMEAEINAAHPIAANASTTLGYLAPGGVPEQISRGVSAGGRALASRLPQAVQKLATRVPGALARPLGAAVSGGATAGATTLAEDLGQGVPLHEALPHAGKSAALGAGVSAVLGAGGEAVAKLRSGARARATGDIANDIIAAEGKRARVTDQKRVAEVKDRLFDLTVEKPELRKAWRESAEKALPQIAEVKAQVARPLDSLYKAVDHRTGGGLTLDQVTGGLRARADKLAQKRLGLEDAKRLRKLADQFEESYLPKEAPPASPAVEAVPSAADSTVPANLRAHGARPALEGVQSFDELTRGGARGHETVGGQTVKGARAVTPAEAAPTVAASDLMKQLGDLRKLRAGAKGVSADALDKEIAGVKAQLPKTASEIRIPTKQFREEVTALFHSANDVMGGLEGTARHQALDKIYRVGKEIIDEHLNASGLPRKMLDKLRKSNDQYFLLSRAEEAIRARGFKEANTPGLKLAHTANQALHSGHGIPALATMAGYAATHPHAIPYMAGSLALAKGLPAVASRVNFAMARSPFAGKALPKGLGGELAAGNERNQQRATASSVAKLIAAARAGASPDEIQIQGNALGLPDDVIAKVAATVPPPAQ